MSAEAKIKKEALRHLSSNWAVGIALTIILGTFPVIKKFIHNILKSTMNINSAKMSIFKYYLNNYNYHNLFYVNIKNLWVYSIISLFAMVFITLLFLPMIMGTNYWAIKLANGESLSINDAFRYYLSKKLFLRAICFQVNLFIRIILWSTVLIFPGISLIWLFTNSNYMFFYLNPVAISSLILFSVVLIIVGFVLWIFIVPKYFLSSYFVVMNDEDSINMCIKKSIKAMRKRNKYVIKLIASFIPWFLLCVFILPILYVVPYFKISLATCAKWLIYEFNKSNNIN